MIKFKRSIYWPSKVRKRVKKQINCLAIFLTLLFMSVCFSRVFIHSLFTISFTFYYRSRPKMSSSQDYLVGSQDLDVIISSDDYSIGQLISKCLLGDFNSPKKRTKTIRLEVGLDRTGHMSLLTGQDRRPKFTGQVLPDRTESGPIFWNILPTQIWCQKFLDQINK